MKKHESVLVFYKKHGIYNPQMTTGVPYKAFDTKDNATIGEAYGKLKSFHKENLGTRYPTSIVKFPREYGLHPTQKPIGLLEYIVKTFSNPGGTVLDPTCGSGTTGLAAKNLGRNYIMFEKEQKYFDICKKRLVEL